MTVEVKVQIPELWKNPEPRFQQAMLMTARDAAPQILNAILDEAPEATGKLKRNLTLGPIIPYGPSRVQISININLVAVPYWYAVIRGHDTMEVGQEWKIYANKARDIFFKGRFVLPARSANNFPKRAVNRILPELTGFVGRSFIVRVAQ